MPKRKALLAGINNYKNPAFNLRGCLNDVDSFAEVLAKSYGFEPDDIQILKDSQASQRGMLQAVEALFSDLGEGDVVVFGYSGHGTQTTKPSDPLVVEAIVPYETLSTASLITNSDINLIARKAIEAKSLKAKVNFTAVYDCCHSGRMYRSLMLNDGGLLEVDIINRVIDLSQLLPPEDIRSRAIELNDDFQVFSACHDDETAADMAANAQKNIPNPRGAFSFILHHLMVDNPKLTVNDLEAILVPRIRTLVAPHMQEPVFAVQEPLKAKPILT